MSPNQPDPKPEYQTMTEAEEELQDGIYKLAFKLEGKISPKGAIAILAVCLGNFIGAEDPEGEHFQEMLRFAISNIFHGHKEMTRHIFLAQIDFPDQKPN